MPYTGEGVGLVDHNGECDGSPQCVCGSLIQASPTTTRQFALRLFVCLFVCLTVRVYTHFSLLGMWSTPPLRLGCRTSWLKRVPYIPLHIKSLIYSKVVKVSCVESLNHYILYLVEWSLYPNSRLLLHMVHYHIASAMHSVCNAESTTSRSKLKCNSQT